jgi:hypothetical protein
MLRAMKKHGIQGSKIGIDGELKPSEIAKAKQVLPGIEWVDVSDLLMEMRMVKTPEELALWRRAYVYYDRAHAFARDYILTHGTGITDFEVKMATELWVNDLLYSELNLAGGKPHHGVQSNMRLAVRAGAVTAYPHPNQPYYSRIGRNMALQVSGSGRIGAYGHENYRMFIIADASGNFDAHMRKLWEVSSAAATCRWNCKKKESLARASLIRSTNIRWSRASRSTFTTGPRTARAWKATSHPISRWATTRCCRRICAFRKSQGCSTRKTAAVLIGVTQW